MGNIGRSSTGCALCRKRKIKVCDASDPNHQILSYLLSDSATRGSLVANDVLKYANPVRVTLFKSNYSYARPRPVHQKGQRAPRFILAPFYLRPILPQQHRSDLPTTTNLTA